MNFLGRLERRFGHLGIPRLIQYVIGLSILGNVINIINPYFYASYLSLDIYKVLHGQIWRLVTFLMDPSVGRDSGLLVDAVWFVIWAVMYYNIGLALERIWGTFRFNLFYFSGIFIIIIFTAAYYFILDRQLGGVASQEISAMISIIPTVDYINPSLFLAFALMNPDVEFLVYFIIPVKAKWLGFVYLLLTGYEVFSGIINKDYFSVALILGCLLNFAIFFFATRNLKKIPNSYRNKKRKIVYRRKVREGTEGPRHRCAICGRTEADAPNLEFRYCSKCEGNYEYCSDHLFTHEHVHK